ncbi:MAG: lamin tail domain-containing protein, partial [Akkermansiaceae bacterium]
MKPATLTLSLTLITLPLFGQSPLITEFMADNNDALVLPDGSSPDWIELHNPGADPADLTGWHLTDNDGALTRWTFPAGVTIPAGGYLVVYASGLDLLDPGAPLHTNFQLERNGEYLALVNPEGTVEQDFAPEYPNQIEDFSYGIILGTEETAYFPNPTPGAPNNEAVLGTVEDTKFSVDRGFFDAPFDVVITSDTPGASIYYT